MKLLPIVLLLACIAQAEEFSTLPDAPHLKTRTHSFVISSPALGDPFIGENNIVHNGTSAFESARVLDWKFLTAHSLYLASIGFDVYATNRGLNSPCGYVEGAGYGAKTPGELARNDLIEFAAVTTVDYVFKRWSRIPNTFYVTTGISTARHVHGGAQWVKHCF